MIYLSIVLLVLMSAMFSGLTIGMFSLSVIGLERKVRLGDKYAIRVHKVRKNGNFLLCTLLLGNAAVNTVLAQLMDDVASGVYAVILGTIIIFAFGEVLPQAIFTRYALKFGYYTTWIVETFMFLLWPVSKPLSLVLDWAFGAEFPERYNRQELAEIISEHGDSTIDKDEKRIMMSAMVYSEKIAREVMTPVTILYHLDANVIISQAILDQIRKEHYSRIPVCDGSRDNVVGILYAKDLIGFNLNHKTTVGDVCKKDGLLFVKDQIKLDSLMNHFLRNKTHMSFVFDEFGMFVGIVTLEDILEEVIGHEILDETDTVADLRHFAKSQADRIVD